MNLSEKAKAQRKSILEEFGWCDHAITPEALEDDWNDMLRVMGRCHAGATIARMVGLSPSCIYSACRKAGIVITAPKPAKLYVVDNILASIPVHCERSGIRYQTVTSRLRKDLSNLTFEEKLKNALVKRSSPGPERKPIKRSRRKNYLRALAKRHGILREVSREDYKELRQLEALRQCVPCP